MAGQKTMAEIGLEILRVAQSELYLNLPYLDLALCALTFVPGDEMTPTLATDGEQLHYNSTYLSERYLRALTGVNRTYLHVVLHCMMRHLAKKRGKDSVLWDLACDIAVESILDALAENYPCLKGVVAPMRRGLYGELRTQMRVLTAEGIYYVLLRRQLPAQELARLRREFFEDDHGLWAPESREQKEQSDRQDKKWGSMSERTQTGLETVMSERSTGGEAVYEQVKVANREGVDYRDFLRRFAVPREVIGVDGDAFDYGFYSYGLRLYGNMPLVEPPETREEKRIQDFVIAVDTSLSTSGALVLQFLAATYSILRSTETFSTKVNIRIIQCDDQVRNDTVIRDLGQLADYMDNFQLAGGSATDFRPVFAYVEQLRATGELPGLRGLIYFTDGMGIYPKKRPPYETAFIMMEAPLIPVEVPPWAIRLSLTESELAQAARPDPLEDEGLIWSESPYL
ncbi:vWA domain-containing protein [Oscillospiraceae bacterium LTW-04]|nr:VWA-like domain-containing protein [Oscillospiraceae bacterium MB24-C1]